jgi:hypothetical protein
MSTRDEALIYATMAGDLEDVRRLIKDGASVHFDHAHLGTALIQACKQGHSRIMSVLLAEGADPNHEPAMGGLSAAGWVMYAGPGRGDMFREIAKHGGVFPAMPLPLDFPLDPSPEFEMQETTPSWVHDVFTPFETHCVVMCCGWHAYDFNESAVRRVVGERGIERFARDIERAWSFTQSSPRWIVFRDFGLRWDSEFASAMLLHLAATVERIRRPAGNQE